MTAMDANATGYDFLNISPQTPDGPDAGIWEEVFGYDFSSMSDGPVDGLLPVVSEWRVRDGCLVTSGQSLESNCIFNKPVFGDVRIEILAVLNKDSMGEISPMLNAPHPDFHRTRNDGYCIQTGADNVRSNVKIARNGIDVAITPFEVLKPDRDYHVIAERTGEIVRLYIDGDLKLDYHDPFPLESAHVGLYGWGHGMRYKSVRVFKRAGRSLHAYMLMGQILYNAKKRDEAGNHYFELADALAGTTHEWPCRYKHALIQIETGDDGVEESIRRLEQSPLKDFASQVKIRWALDTDRIALALAAARELLNDTANPRARLEAARTLWVDLRGRQMEMDACITPDDMLNITEVALALSMPFPMLMPLCIRRGIDAALLELPVQTERQASLLSALRGNLDSGTQNDAIQELLLEEARLWALRWNKFKTFELLDRLDRDPALSDEMRLKSNLIRATALYRCGDLAESERIFSDIYQSDQTPQGLKFEALWGWARVVRRHPGRIDDALKLYYEAVGLGEDIDQSARAKVELGRTLIQMCRFEDAIEVFEEVEMRFGSEGEIIARALVPKAMALYYTDCLDEAIDCLDELLQDFPYVPKWSDAARCLLGLYYLARGETANAEKTVAPMVKSDPLQTIQAGPMLVQRRHRLMAGMVIGAVPAEEILAHLDDEGVYNKSQVALFAAESADVRGMPADEVNRWLTIAADVEQAESLHKSIARFKLQRCHADSE